jgi:hypothetical protein
MSNQCKYRTRQLLFMWGLDFNIESPMSACLFHVKEWSVAEFFDEIVIYSSNTDEFIDELLQQIP